MKQKQVLDWFKKKKRLEFLQSTPSLQAQQPFRAHAGL